MILYCFFVIMHVQFNVIINEHIPNWDKISREQHFNIIHRTHQEEWQAIDWKDSQKTRHLPSSTSSTWMKASSRNSNPYKAITNWVSVKSSTYVYIFESQNHHKILKKNRVNLKMVNRTKNLTPKFIYRHISIKAFKKLKDPTFSCKIKQPTFN